MKVHNSLKELLEAYEKFRDNSHYHNYKTVINLDIEAFIASNSLALDKQRPLAKNKQTQLICPQCKSDDVLIMTKYSINKCHQCHWEWANKADATSR